MTAQARYEAEVSRLWSTQAPDGAHDLGHLRRVWKTARLIAMDVPADGEILLAACFFHDLVNLPKDGFPETKLAGVAHAIAAHSFSAGIPPETPEARILQDADRLEALGAIGIARMFHVAGQMGGGLFDADDPMALHRALDDSRFALDHLETKLLRLPDSMQTEPGRAMAEERADWLMSFRTRLLSEIG